MIIQKNFNAALILACYPVRGGGKGEKNNRVVAWKFLFYGIGKR